MIFIDLTLNVDMRPSPYEMDTFTQPGVLAENSGLDSRQAWQPGGGETQVLRHGEFQLDNAIVAFP